jgi:P4 family phage/plasmid primase-like protien
MPTTSATTPISVTDPKTWLTAAGNYPLTEDVLTNLNLGFPRRFLISALYKDTPAELNAMLPLIPNGTAKVNTTQTLEEWLKELHGELKSNPAYQYKDHVFKQWNKLMLADNSGFDADYYFNQLALAALFVNQGPYEFDPDQKTFFRYDPTTGVWTNISDAELKHDLVKFMVPYVAEYPGYVQHNKRLLDSIVDAAAALSFRNAPNRADCLLHVANCMLHVDGKNHAKRPFSPAYSSRNRVPVEYDPKKTYPNKFVNFLKCSLLDDDIELLRNWCGMAIMGTNPFHKVLLVSGEANSGKSQLVELIELIIGMDNVATLSAERLEDRFELSGFIGKTLLVSKDVSKHFLQSKAAHVIKSLSGDRGIKVELKNSNRRVTLNGPFNILISSNANLLVNLQGDTGAWQRRLLILPFNQTKVLAARGLKAPTPIADYGRKLFEEEGAAILNWILQGAWNITQARRTTGEFPMTPAQKRLTADLLASSDPLNQFIKDNIEKSAGDTLSTASIEKSYQDYCDENVVVPLENIVFTRKLRHAMFECRDSKHGEVIDPATKKRVKGYRNVRFKTSVKSPTGGAANGNGATNGDDHEIPATRQNGKPEEKSKLESKRI